MKTLRAHGFNQRPRFEQVGYLERNEPLPLDQPDRKATSFVTSHFYLDDFVQSSEDPQPSAPAAHASAGNFRGWLRMTWREIPRPALASNGQGPPSITDRLRSTADGAQAAADLIGAGAVGLAAAQAFRSQLPQDAAEYVRLNVLPSGPGAAASTDHRPAQ